MMDVASGQPSNDGPFAPQLVATYRVAASEVGAYSVEPPPTGHPIPSASERASRPDVSAFFGGFALLDRVGYRIGMAGDRSRDPLFVCAFAPSGQQACTEMPVR